MKACEEECALPRQACFLKKKFVFLYNKSVFSLAKARINWYNKWNWIPTYEDTVWKVVNWVDEKEIRFESWTTAITVFDKMGAVHPTEQSGTAGSVRIFRSIISQDTCRIFFGSTRLWCEECSRSIASRRDFGARGSNTRVMLCLALLRICCALLTAGLKGYFLIL